MAILIGRLASDSTLPIREEPPAGYVPWRHFVIMIYMANRGKAFENELRVSMETAGLYVERIPDALFWTGERIASRQTPSDFHAYKAATNLECFMIEAKAVSGKSLPFNRLEPHQREALISFNNFHANAHGYVAANFYDGNNLRNYNKCYMIPIDVWAEYEGGSERKSLPVKACEDDPRIIECPRAPGSIYDMNNWSSIFI